MRISVVLLFIILAPSFETEALSTKKKLPPWITPLKLGLLGGWAYGARKLNAAANNRDRDSSYFHLQHNRGYPEHLYPSYNHPINVDASLHPHPLPRNYRNCRYMYGIECRNQLHYVGNHGKSGWNVPVLPRQIPQSLNFAVAHQRERGARPGSYGQNAEFQRNIHSRFLPFHTNVHRPNPAPLSDDFYVITPTMKPNMFPSFHEIAHGVNPVKPNTNAEIFNPVNHHPYTMPRYQNTVNPSTNMKSLNPVNRHPYTVPHPQNTGGRNRATNPRNILSKRNLNVGSRWLPFSDYQSAPSTDVVVSDRIAPHNVSTGYEVPEIFHSPEPVRTKSNGFSEVSGSYRVEDVPKIFVPYTPEDIPEIPIPFATVRSNFSLHPPSYHSRKAQVLSKVDDNSGASMFQTRKISPKADDISNVSPPSKTLDISRVFVPLKSNNTSNIYPLSQADNVRANVHAFSSDTIGDTNHKRNMTAAFRGG